MEDNNQSSIESLDLYRDLMNMKPKEVEALKWTLDALEESEIIQTTPERAAWHYFLFCATSEKTIDGFAKTVELIQEIPAKVMGALILEMQIASCQRIVIGTSGKFVGFVRDDGQQLAYGNQAEERQAYVFSNEDLKNIASGRGQSRSSFSQN